jgi:hypothetical protein
MRVNLFYFIIVIIIFGCEPMTKVSEKEKKATEQNEYLDSTYNVFLNFFDSDVSFPLQFDKIKNYYPEKQKLPSDLVNEFICDNVNYCLNTTFYQKNLFYGLYKREFQLFDIVIYVKIDIHHNNQIVLVTYSKVDKKKINEVTLCSYDNFNHEIEATINKSFEINIKGLYSNIHLAEPLTDDPYKYFIVYEVLSNYLISDNGKIITISKEKPKSYLSTIKNGKFYYPVELPEGD